MSVVFGCQMVLSEGANETLRNAVHQPMDAKRVEVIGESVGMRVRPRLLGHSAGLQDS